MDEGNPHRLAFSRRMEDDGSSDSLIGPARTVRWAVAELGSVNHEHTAER